jgi:hypothetical protein
MARGWESKSVADQIEEGKTPRDDQYSVNAKTPEDRAKQERLMTLQLSRSRLLQQLDRAKHPAHRRVLLSGLQAIEKEIEDIS